MIPLVILIRKKIKLKFTEFKSEKKSLERNFLQDRTFQRLSRSSRYYLIEFIRDETADYLPALHRHVCILHETGFVSLQACIDKRRTDV